MEHLLAREDLCRFVAACFYQPCTEFVEEKLFDSIVATARVLDPALAARAERLREAFFAEELETLLVDYTRLFLGPSEPLARPYGCYWLTGQTTVMQEPTLAVMSLYREAGFEFDEASLDVPDHVAVELEFLYLLAFRRHRAQETGDIDAMAEIEQLQERFLSQHLGSWIARFAGAVKEGAQTSFYRELAEFAPHVVRATAAVH
jgi:TorA maturation chaperone TorD